MEHRVLDVKDNQHSDIAACSIHGLPALAGTHDHPLGKSLPWSLSVNKCFWALTVSSN